MADDRTVEVHFSAETEQLEAALKRAAAMVQSTASSMSSSKGNEAQLKALQTVTDAAKMGSQERVQDAKAEVAFTTQIWGEGSLQQIEATRRAVAASKAADEQGIADAKAASAQKAKVAQMTAETSIQIGRMKLQAQEAELDQEVAAGEISAEKKIQILRDATAKENQLENTSLTTELAALQTGTMAYKRVLDQQSILKERYSLQQTKLDQQAAQANLKSWQDALQPLNQAFDISIRGVIQGTQTLRQSMARAAQSVLLSWIDTEEKVLAKHLATELAKTTATEAGVAARTAAEQSGSATSLLGMAADALKTIASDAAQTFAGVFAFLSPTMGPAAAAPAMVAQATVLGVGGTVSSAAGGYDIPAGVNPLTQLHAQEMVLPANLANSVRAMTQNAGANAGGDIHIHGPLVQAIDTQTGAQFIMRNSGAIASTLARQFRNANAALAGVN